MRLYWEPPPQDEAFGRLVDENGELVEGVMIQDVWGTNTDLVSVSFTLLIETMPVLDQTAVVEAISGLRELEVSLSVP